MPNFRQYLDYAERYVQKAELEKERNSRSDIDWLLIPATILAWTAIESFVNNRLDDFGSLPEDMFALHERALLLEKRVRFCDSGEKIGTFTLEGTEYRKLEDKIFFLIAKFGKKDSHNIKKDVLWIRFLEFKDVRDSFMHPRTSKEKEIDINTVKI